MRTRLLRLVPILSFGCSLVAGFDEFSGHGGGAGHAGGGFAASGNAGQAGASANLGGTPNTESGGTTSGAGTGADASTGGANGGNGAGPTGGSVGAAGSEAGADQGGGAAAEGSAGSGAGGTSDGGSNATAGSAGFAGEASCGELLANGDFDLGPTPDWQEHVTYSDSLRIVVPKDDQALAAEDVQPVNGEYLAWLGGIPDNDQRHYTSRLHQSVRIPARTSRLSFSGWIRIKTLEPENDVAYDRAYAQIVQVHESPGESSVLRLFAGWSNRDSGTEWVEFEFATTELDALRDRTLTLEVYSDTDQEYQTSFWFDSLSLYAECER
jgi:hypothetical protein